MTVENEFLDLPDDPTEAFALLERQLRARVEAVGTPSELRRLRSRYIEEILLFDEVHNLGFFNLAWLNQISNDPVDNYYEQLSSVARKNSTKILMQAAKSQKETSYNLILLDRTTKRQIHDLIKEIRARILELDIDIIRRESLLAKLNAFAAEVDRDRTRTQAFFAFAVEASRVTKEVTENVAPLEGLLDKLSGIVDRVANRVTQMLPGRESQKQIEYKPEDNEDPDESR